MTAGKRLRQGVASSEAQEEERGSRTQRQRRRQSAEQPLDAGSDAVVDGQDAVRVEQSQGAPMMAAPTIAAAAAGASNNDEQVMRSMPGACYTCRLRYWLQSRLDNTFVLQLGLEKACGPGLLHQPHFTCQPPPPAPRHRRAAPSFRCSPNCPTWRQPSSAYCSEGSPAPAADPARRHARPSPPAGATSWKRRAPRGGGWRQLVSLKSRRRALRWTPAPPSRVPSASA